MPKNVQAYRFSSWSVFFFLAAICFLLYHHIIHAPFQFDDVDFIVENPAIHNLHDLKAIWSYAGYPVRFLSFLSFALNYHVHQLEVEGYHLVNIIIHLLNAFCIWQLVRLTLRGPIFKKEGQDFPVDEIALCSALVFLVHPLQTQAVTYITQRFASLATLFYLSALCAYARARLCEERSLLFYGLCFIFGLMGMFTKQIVFTLPITILLYDQWFYGEASKKRKGHIWFFLILLAGLLILPFLYQFKAEGLLGGTFKSRSHAYSGEMITAGKYLLTEFRVILKYIQLLCFPIGQNLDYTYDLSHSFFDPKTFLSFCVLVSLFIYGLFLRRKKPVLSFCILYFFIALSVESSIIPIPHVIFEHRVYLPSMGFCFALSFVMYTQIRSPWKRRAALMMIIGSFAVMTFLRNFVWQSRIALWTDAVKKSPQKARPYNNLGLSYLEKGRHDEAFRQFQLALERNPYYAKAHNALGDLYRMKGDLASAWMHFDHARRLAPRTAKYWNNRAVINKAQKNYQQAFDDWTEALRLDPSNIESLNNLGNFYRSQRNFASALEHYNRAIALYPHFVETYNNRGLLYKYQKQYGLALEDYNKALALNVDHLAALNNRGLIYKEQKLYDLALADFNRALTLNSKEEKLFNNRGFVYEMKDMFDLALQDYNQAIAINPKYALAYSNRGFIFLQRHDIEKAMADFNQGLSVGGEEGRCYYHRSLAYFALEDYAQAMKDFKQSQAHGFSANPKYFLELQERLNHE